MQIIQKLLQVIHACLHTAAALHVKQVVLRDFRHANVLWDKDGPFIIDLELAAVPPLKVAHPFLKKMHLLQHLEIVVAHMCNAAIATVAQILCQT